MKNTIITITLTMACAVNAFPQSFMTNTVAECSVEGSLFNNIRMTMNFISRVYDVRICTEAPRNYTTPTWPQSSVVFTNATFGQVFETIMENTTNLTWRYENSTDSIYVYPLTNAITLMRVGPIALTNEPVWKVFYEDDMVTRKIEGLVLSGREGDYWNDNVSLEIEEAYLWEVLDEIVAQISEGISWDLQVTPPRNGIRYWLRYFTTHHDRFKNY